MDVYVTGCARERKSAIIVAHDVFGVQSGRTREICDEIAERLGILVVAPDWWKNGGCGGAAVTGAMEGALWPAAPASRWASALRYLRGLLASLPWVYALWQRGWEGCRADLMDVVCPRVREMGAARLGLLGFCWGGWFVTRASAEVAFACGASCHPSVSALCLLHWEALGGVYDAVRCPQLLLSAGNDAADTKEGGLAQQTYRGKAFGDACAYVEYADMAHGWVNRGDTGDAALRAASRDARDRLVAFYDAHI